MSMVTLIFYGAPGYVNSYNDHRKGKEKDYDKEKAAQLMHDFPGSFKLVTPQIEKPTEKKETKISNHKMVENTEEKKEEKKEDKKRNIRRRGNN